MTQSVEKRPEDKLGERRMNCPKEDGKQVNHRKTADSFNDNSNSGGERRSDCQNLPKKNK